MNKVCGVRGIGRAVGISHLFAIAVVGGDNAFAVELKQFRNNPAATFIYRLDRFNAGFHNPGVPDHIRIGKVEDDEVKFVQVREKIVRYPERAHFGLQIVGGDFGRWDQLSLFAWKRLFDSAIKEIGHVRVFFRLGDAQL